MRKKINMWWPFLQQVGRALPTLSSKGGEHLEIDNNTTALSVAQVCELWHCSRQYVHKLIKAGKIDAVKVAPNYCLIPLNDKNKKFLHID